MSTYSLQLIAQAKSLARLDPRRPQQANVRRAVSSAYYAVFHFVIERSAVALCGGATDARPLRSMLARAFQHGAMRAVAVSWNEASAALSKGKGPHGLPAPVAAALVELNAGIPAELAELAATFADLQEWRHEADYNLSVPISRADAIARGSDAERVVTILWPAIEKHPTTPLFLLAMLVQGQLGRR